MSVLYPEKHNSSTENAKSTETVPLLDLDIQQAQRQLELLGIENEVFLRGFYHSDDPRKGKDSGQKKNGLNVRLIESWLKDKRGAYIVVNGGGHTDVEVKVGRAIFYEHDDLDKELQINLWKTLGLPTPTFQVDSGGKSIHSYWVFAEPIPIEQWRKLQIDLLEFADGDRVIKNPSRVMRLAGAVHQKGGRTQIISDSEIKYSYEELREIIPTAPPTQKPNLSPEYTPTDETIPLYICLSKDDRHIIDHGVGKGGRNNSGAKLARNLIGTAHRLQYLDYRVDGRPEDLFEDYCDRCSPPIAPSERKAIWKSALKDNPTATLTDQMIENCIKAHHRGLNRSNGQYQTNGNNAPQHAACGNNKPELENRILSKEETIQRAKNIIQFPIPESQQTTEINELSKAANISAYESRKLVSDVEWEENLNADLVDSKQNFEKLINPVQLKLDEIFPAPLANALKTRAQSDRIDPVRILQTVLPIVGTMLGGQVRVVLKQGETFKDDWEEYPIFYTVDIAPPSSGKSATQRGLIQPIQDLQRLELERVEQARIELAGVEEKWKSMKKDEKALLAETSENPKIFEQMYCTARRYLFDQTTIQALGKKLSQQPMLNGSCWLRDELYATFKSLDQFTKGKGEALEFILSAWNGPLWGTVDRTDDANSYRFKGQCLNIAGGIQPAVAPKIWNTNQDPNGLLSRFLAAISQIPDDFEQWSTVKVNIYDTVSHYLQEIERLPNTRLLLDDAAQSEFIKYWSLLRRGYKLYLEDNPAYSYFLGKQCSYVGRFALLIHVLNCVATGESIDSPIDITTIKKAIKLSQFYCHQFRLLQASSSVDDDADLDHVLYLVYQTAKAKNGTITTRDISNRSRKFQKMTYQGKKINASVALKMFEAIADAGYGRVDGKSLVLKSISPQIALCQNDTNDTGFDTASNPYVSVDLPHFDTGDTATRFSSDTSKSTESQEGVQNTGLENRIIQPPPLDLHEKNIEGGLTDTAVSKTCHPIPDKDSSCVKSCVILTPDDTDNNESRPMSCNANIKTAARGPRLAPPFKGGEPVTETPTEHGIESVDKNVDATDESVYTCEINTSATLGVDPERSRRVNPNREFVVSPNSSFVVQSKTTDAPVKFEHLKSGESIKDINGDSWKIIKKKSDYIVVSRNWRGEHQIYRDQIVDGLIQRLSR
ncbi:MAG: DUF3987 domain-containing protein [Cyanobacteria bacterium J06592_8]